MKNTVDIKFVEEGVEITLEESRFRLDLDERGSPKFPESLKEKLPPYMPEMVERWIKGRGTTHTKVPLIWQSIISGGVLRLEGREGVTASVISWI
jgi:hypothetical protein